MGQKINPIGLRLGVNRGWDSTWFAKKKDFGKYLIEDFKIRKYIKKNIVNSGVSEITIERSSKKCTVSIHTSRPGFVIGKKGADIEKIKKNGLAKGGSLENAVVVNDKEILNPEGLRNEKEFVNHKILDCIGDLYTSGYRIIASVTCSQGGHYLTNQLLRKVFRNKENFSILEIKEKNLPYTLINRNLLRSIA